MTAPTLRLPARRAGVIARYLGLTIAALLFLYPLWWALSNSVKQPSQIITDSLTFNPRNLTLDSYRSALDSVPLLTGFRNTAIVLLIKGAITMFFCPLAGYAFAKYDFRFKNLLFGAVLMTLMLPVLVLIIPLLLEMSSLHWVNTYQALILPGSIDAFSIFWMRQTIQGVPDELLDAARVDGAGEFSIYLRVVLPVIRPGLAALGVLTFMNIYNDFVWPVVAANSSDKATLQVILSTLSSNVAGGKATGQDFTHIWGQLLAASSLAMIPVLLVFVLLQRHFINGILAGSVKG
jgi:multiple sugar transport system permease protein